MYKQIFLKQLKRSRKTVFYLLLLAAATAFFVASLNLYRNSVSNLEKAEEAYSTLAVVELYGDVDRYGNLVEEDSADHIGYKPVAVKGYDFSGLLDSEAVESWDLRSQYMAYIENQPAFLSEGLQRTLSNLIRFKIKGQRPVTVAPSGSGGLAELELIDSAADCFRYGTRFDGFSAMMLPEEWESYTEDIKKINRSDVTDTVTLYPDVEYVAGISSSGSWKWSNEAGVWEIDPEKLFSGDALNISICSLWTDLKNFRVVYDEDEEKLIYDEAHMTGAPFPIQRWEDVENDPELKAYYEKAWEDVRIQHNIHNIQLTNDFTSIPAYHVGAASIVEGRLITEEEYASGAAVCIVSEEFASYQNWHIGDKLNMRLYETYYQPDRQTSLQQPLWDKEFDETIHPGEYEIVGMFRKNPVNGNSGISANTLDMSIYNIYIPEKSVNVERPADEQIVHSSLLSIRLKNGSVDKYLEDMEAKGFTTEKAGQFNPKFTFYDQGYSLVQPGLQSMNGTSKLLLALSAMLLLITCTLLAYFFWQNQKQTVGIFRLLGGAKAKAVSAVLLCAIILCIIAAALGGAVGYGMAEVVGSGIMNSSLEENELDHITQAYILDSVDKEDFVEVKADPLVTITACGMVLLFPLLLLGFMAVDIGKEPRELLPQAKL